MHINSLAIIGSIVAILLPLPNAIAAPTKQETYDFITNKLVFKVKDASRWPILFKTNIITNLISNEDMCSLTYTISEYDKSDNLESIKQYDIDLRMLNPQRISKHKASDLESNMYNESFGLVQIVAIENKPIIKYKLIWSDNKKSANPSLIDVAKQLSFSQLLTLDYDSAERVKKALRHLVTICGGKDELF